MGSVLVAATPVKPRTELARAQSQSQRMEARSQSQSQSQSQSRLPALFAGASTASSSRTQPQVQVQPSKFSRVDSLVIDTDEEEDDELNVVATPTRTKRQRTMPCVSDDGEEKKRGMAGFHRTSSFLDLENSTSGKQSGGTLTGSLDTVQLLR